MQSPPPDTSMRAACSGKHAVAAIFHVAFKAAAVSVYLFGSLLSKDFVVQFVICVLLLAADFWTVKNVTGRLLVALRYWHETDATGQPTWRFEAGDPTQVNAADHKWFWVVLAGNAGVWALFLVSCVYKLDFTWFPLVALAFGLAAANFYGYWKCNRAPPSQVVRNAVLDAAKSNPNLVASVATTVVSAATAAAQYAASQSFQAPPPASAGPPAGPGNYDPPPI
eukprot:NODE_1568_length_809_cov_70.587977_g1519_i0.p1 GENE.NODE_1568_length_809_cov_70.587977_g1519_i0~~NODE_1568_length_809_cov_70.587977_g1519_i0.p1  ORF type:complete len:224 (+),score=25.95 NODE_1568_length_809_cov_70.587977_g1519_i0:82-753(+)